MNWKKLMQELLKFKTLQQIADECGLASKGHAHDILSGRQKSVHYEAGLRLVELHRKLMRRAAK
ncbi:MAG: hypothetical protein PHD99_04695 [Candidatus Moranbacteria bacterium]|nr:hypothetical protein [Candidatus Moranbacteria bacterium]